MKARHFNSIMPTVNEVWAAEVLDMSRNTNKGPDLIRGNLIVEVKFKLMHKEKYTHLCWRILEHQKKYKANGKIAYWALGTYHLSRQVSDINTENTSELENLVISRELYIVQWEWVNQFQVYPQSGKTDISEWNNKLIFAKGRLLPETRNSKKVKKGMVYITEGVDGAYFRCENP